MMRLLTLVLALTAIFVPPSFADPVPRTRADLVPSLAPVVRQAAPAVVNIYARRVVARSFSPFAGDPFFDRMFRDFGPVRPEVENSLGSGVVVTSDGLVVSNHHVVEAAEAITVVFADRREFPATVVLADADSDLAVLRIEGASDLPALEFRDSNGLEVGELVLAIGNPFGLGQTVSMGIVSGLARSALFVGDGRGYFIQTDAAINPGNSGGALVDVEGRLVGINTAILTRSGASHGVGFAIPSNLVRAVVEQAAAGAERFRRPWAGVAGQPVDAAMAEALGLSRPEGVLLSDIHPASPFAAAGLVPGDLVLEIDSAPVNSPQEMLFRLSARGIGQNVDVVWKSGRNLRRGRVPMIPPPEDPPRDPVTVTADVALRGLEAGRINPAVISEYGLPLGARGVVVLSVADRAARAGLRPGDVILAVNGVPVEEPAALLTLAAQGTRTWTLDLLRDEGRLQLRFRF